MPSMFPCPNPVCTHVFSPDAVKGASSLVCPKCGTIFRFASAGTAKKSVAPKAPPPPPIAAVPMAQPVAAPDEAGQDPPSFNFHSTADMVAPRTRRAAGKRGLRRLFGWLAGLAAIVLVLAVAAWGGLWLRHFLARNNSTGEDSIRAANAFNARFVLPGKPWMRDKDLQMRFHVHIGMRSSEHDNGMALLFKDYRDRLPRDAEMVDEAVGKLRSFFQGLEWELQPKDEQARLAERPAQVLRFQGDDSERVTMNGECYMLAFRGYGYWFFTWAPLGELESDREAIQAEWVRLRQNFSLLDGRKSWKEKPPETEILDGKKAKYRLAYGKGLWTREAADDEDAHLDFLLRGHEPDPERRPLAGKDATVQVLVLPPKADLQSATAAALAYVKQREMKLYERTTWEPIKDKNVAVDRDAKIGAESGHVSKLHVKCTEDLERYLSIAVVNRPDGVVVLIGDCLWERRDFWDQEFTKLFMSFRVE